ncbi:hypothetical protein EIN_176160 [Entamoeba invadens IP1]|uniref:hypothetical protein n=1 Tax=Entamoeba invadens IP1 TaxID=370355 RepID=UPI0002C3DCDB|nr:hypothetical protein EIN_176160 [Entamoeba invadens IP1]ELP93809.1 hypothetical protein EIN_176160 [Entamoeba invadens IP1]|eukprot:XP_004260580.1 hypothetical protein EIN_176160 [Entamoeba invadens IP1]
MMALLLAFISFAFSTNYKCTDASSFNPPNFQNLVTFSESITDSQVVIGTGAPTTVKGFYYKFTATDELDSVIFNSNSCDKLTQVTHEIYVFGSCSTTGVAENYIARSGIEETCDYNVTDIPTVNFKVETGKTYYILLKRLVDGDAQFHVSKSTLDTSNTDCDKAKPITSLPYIEESVLTNQNEKVKPQCFKSATTTYWYSLIGDGKDIVVYTCGVYTNFDTKIVLIDTPSNGGICTDAECLKMADDGCSKTSTSSIMAFTSELGKTYYIGVYGNLAKEGQFKLQVEHLEDEIPATCGRAIPIKTLPFTRQVTVTNVWPPVEGSCYGTSEPVKGIYFTFTGENKDYVFSTCKSITEDLETIGVSIEAIKDCTSMECAIQDGEYGECGDNNFLVKHINKGETFTFFAYCNDGECKMNIDVYEKTADHSVCEHAMELVNTEYFGEKISIANQQLSVHGCNSEAKQDRGTWYSLTKNVINQVEHFTILAMDMLNSRVNYIEFPRKCGLIQCDGVAQGSFTVSLTTSNPRLIYIYPYSSTSKFMNIQFIKEDVLAIDECPSAMPITLPFTALHTFNSKKTTTFCRGLSYAANYYRFTSEKGLDVDISTCFPRTLVNTGLEMTSGCAGEPTTMCVKEVADSPGCTYNAAQMQAHTSIGSDYVVTVYNEGIDTSSLRQYRLAVFTTEVPENSICTRATPIIIDEGFVSYTVLNKYSRTSDFGDFGTTKGNYFSVMYKKDITITVRTCSSYTTMKTNIVTATKCSLSGTAEAPISMLDDFTSIATSSIIGCDIYGTMLDVNVTANEMVYIFIGPENFADEGFIGVDFFIPEPEPDPETSSGTEPSHSSESSIDSKDNNNDSDTPVAWIVVGVLTFILFLVIIGGAMGAVLFMYYKKKSGYSNLA